MKSIKQRITNIISQTLNKNESEIADTTTLEELNVDSLDLVNIRQALEIEFVIDVIDKDIDNIKTISDITNYISKIINKTELGTEKKQILTKYYGPIDE